jgi:hypothetical protein
MEVFLLAPTASGDGDGVPRFCTSLPTSPARFHGNVLKTLDELPGKGFSPFFLLMGPSEVIRLFGQVNHGQNWKGWERSGEKA